MSVAVYPAFFFSFFCAALRYAKLRGYRLIYQLQQNMTWHLCLKHLSVTDHLTFIQKNIFNSYASYVSTKDDNH